MVEIPCKDPDDPRRKTTTMRVPMILPHELLEFLTASWLLFFCSGAELFLFLTLCIWMELFNHNLTVTRRCFGGYTALLC